MYVSVKAFRCSLRSCVGARQMKTVAWRENWNCHEKIRCACRTHVVGGFHARCAWLHPRQREPQSQSYCWGMVRQGSRCTVSLSHVCLQRRRDDAAGQPAGTVTASSYDTNGTLTDGPTSPTPLEGKRVTLP